MLNRSNQAYSSQWNVVCATTGEHSPHGQTPWSVFLRVSDSCFKARPSRYMCTVWLLQGMAVEVLET